MITGNRENNKKFGSVFLSVMVLLSISVIFSNDAFAQISPSITLNSDEFIPGQTVEITGNEFSADTNYDIYVITIIEIVITICFYILKG